MSSVTSIPVLVFILASGVFAADTPELRVCSDPNNLPYSNQQQRGFENDLAQMIAKDFAAHVSYTWLAQRGGFFDKTLDSGLCDLVMGVPSGMANIATTRPYYRSGYVFVSRQSRHLDIRSLDDPRLRQLQIGVHILGDGDSDVPPVQALTARGIVRNLVGFSIFGNLDEHNPSADVVKAVERGDVDLAVAWGPIAGYFARASVTPLQVMPIEPDPLHPSLPMTFDIGIGVRRQDRELKNRLDAELERRKPEIDLLLMTYGIPRTAPSAQAKEH